MRSARSPGSWAGWAALMFGGQVGQALGKLAEEVLTARDIGLPLAPAGTAVLVPPNIEAFGDGLDRPADEVRLFVALREAAHQRLFAHVPWLRQQLQDAVEAYARGIRVDREAIERGIRGDGGGSEAPASTRATRRACSSCWRAPRAGGDARRSRWRCAGWRRCWRSSRAGSTPSSPRPPKDRLPGHSALAETMRRRRAVRRPGRADVRHAGRAGAAAPPAARRGDRLGGHGPAARQRRAATGSGRTPTCCRPRTTSTSRWTSSPARAWTTSSPR